jgi:hypothetical protein
MFDYDAWAKAAYLANPDITLSPEIHSDSYLEDMFFEPEMLDDI